MRKKQSPATLSTCRAPVTDQADATINPEDGHKTLQAQYLASIFGVPAHTAVTIAELAFGGAA